MEIKIMKTGVLEVNGDSSDVMTTHTVTDSSREFEITCRTNHSGRYIAIAGKEGFLYINGDDNTVYRQVVALGGGCGLLIDDETVEGLSPWAVRGVIIAHQNKETREVTITTERSEGLSDSPSVIIDGKPTDLHRDMN